jgi:hypothetical protein
MVFTLPAEASAGSADPPRREVSPDAIQSSERYDPDRKSSRPPSTRAERPPDDDDEPLPRRSRSRRSSEGSPLPWILGLGGAALLLFMVCGGVITVVAFVGLSRAKEKNVPPGGGLVVANPPVVNPPVVMNPPVVVNPPVMNPPIPNPPIPNPPVFNPPVGKAPGMKPPIGKKGFNPPPVGIPAGVANASVQPPGVNLPPGAPARGLRVTQFNGFLRVQSDLNLQDVVFDINKGNNNNKRCKEYVIDLQAGRTYVIDLESNAFDAYLHLEELNGQFIMANDDVAPGNLNSRITFTPNQTASYVIVATCLATGTGPFTLTVRDTSLANGK